MKICEEFYINGEWVKPINELKTLDVIIQQLKRFSAELL